MCTKLYVGNLSYKVDKETLEKMFALYGNVLSVQVIGVRDIGRPKRFGFVEMSSEHEARKAIRALDGKQMDDRNLTVRKVEPREDPVSGGGYVGGRSSRY